MEESILIKYIYEAINRPYNNLIDDMRKIISGDYINNIDVEDYQVLAFYLSGLYKKMTDYDIYPKSYKSYLIYKYPIELNNNNRPLNRKEFEERYYGRGAKK